MAGNMFLAASNLAAEESFREASGQESAPAGWDDDDGARCAADIAVKGFSIEPEWSVRWSRGFAWWAGNHRQMVWADPEFIDGGKRKSRLCAVTDGIAGLGGMDELKVLDAIDRRNALGNMAGAWVFEEEEARARFWTTRYVDHGLAVWARKDFGLAAILGLGDVETRAACGLAAELFVDEAVSAHPRSGRREVPAGILSLGGQLAALADDSLKASFMLDVAMPFEEIYKGRATALRNDCAGIMVNFKLKGMPHWMLVVECGRGSYSNPGFRIGLRFVRKMPFDECLRLIAALNRLETVECSHSDFMGTWVMERDYGSGRGSIAYRAFLPDLIRPELKILGYAEDMERKGRWAAGLIGSGSVLERLAEALRMKDAPAADEGADVGGAAPQAVAPPATPAPSTSATPVAAAGAVQSAGGAPGRAPPAPGTRAPRPYIPRVIARAGEPAWNFFEVKSGATMGYPDLTVEQCQEALGE